MDDPGEIGYCFLLNRIFLAAGQASVATDGLTAPALTHMPGGSARVTVNCSVRTTRLLGGRWAAWRRRWPRRKDTTVSSNHRSQVSSSTRGKGVFWGWRSNGGLATPATRAAR